MVELMKAVKMVEVKKEKNNKRNALKNSKTIDKLQADIKEFEKTIEKMKKTKDEAEEKAKKVSEIKGRMEDEFSKELKELNNQAPGLKILAKYDKKEL